VKLQKHCRRGMITSKIPKKGRVILHFTTKWMSRKRYGHVAKRQEKKKKFIGQEQRIRKLISELDVKGNSEGGY